LAYHERIKMDQSTGEKIKRLVEKLRGKKGSGQQSRLRKLKPGEPIIEMRGITKRFPGVLANDHIDFDLKACEIHGLLGENGAGKTTLMNILYGLYRPDEGSILVQGEPVVIRSPKDAIELGIGMVHQHFMLIPVMSVTENIVLGLKSAREPLLDIGQAEKRIAELSEIYKLKVDPKARIEQLSMGERQRVEILKALYRGARVLILDEPTSVLTPQETEDFFKTLRSMVNQGLTIVFITHKLREAIEISDRVTVLRRGKVVARSDTKLTNPIELAKMMVGREVVTNIEKQGIKEGKVALEVKNLSAMGDEGLLALKNVSFSIHEGEILGIAGVSGNGQRELAEVITGMRKASEGKLYIFGKDMTNLPPKKIIEQGVGHIPEDRLGTGVIPDFSIAENLVLETHSMSPFSYQWFLPFTRRYFLNRDEIRKNAERLINEYEIATPSIDAPARNLSGGNLQRLILAKVLSTNPKLLIATHPTSGLDVAATEFIHRKLIEQREKGVAILLISEDLNEIMSLSDRIAVMYEGKIVGIIPASKVQIQEIGLMMTGVK
jgi:simple sugar transport system ATP-binding protein